MKNAFNEEPIVISAWICAGKTYLTKKYSYITELPSGDFKYILTKEQQAVENKESLKSTVRAINPNWPQNYYEAIFELFKHFSFNQSILHIQNLQMIFKY